MSIRVSKPWIFAESVLRRELNRCRNSSAPRARRKSAVSLVFANSDKTKSSRRNIQIVTCRESNKDFLANSVSGERDSAKCEWSEVETSTKKNHRRRIGEGLAATVYGRSPNSSL